jgi:cell division septation protein DedD
MPAPGRPTTLASIGTAAPAAAGGGYAVQVSSQRSEVDAQTEFRVLQAKFPNQLGGHRPMVRRADLGDKGVYYRALVGPFASMEQAAQMCSSLKAAGGNCIVQKD